MNETAFTRPLRFYGAVLGMLILWSAVPAASGSIRDIDFKNFVYPSLSVIYTSVPSRPKWIDTQGAKEIAMRGGRYRFQCDDSPCPLITFDRAIFGAINGLSEDSAIVVTTYHSGGSAAWQYIYIIAVRSGKPEVMAWLETGSRAYMGLRTIAVDRGDLVLNVNDPEKREGDCCSTGTITYRYRWHEGSFHQLGPPVLEDDPIDDAQSQSLSPSFDCANAITPTETLICRDSELATMDNAMAAAYREALQKLPPKRRDVLRREHSEWFAHYSSACNAVSDRDRRECVIRYLAAHTAHLRSTLP